MATLQQDIGFYAFTYFDDHHRFIVWDREEGERPRVGLQSGDIHKSASKKGMVISKSLLLHRSRRGAGLDHVKFTLKDNWYEPPWMLRSAGLEGLSEAVEGISCGQRNSTTLAVRGANVVGKHIEFYMQRSCYFNYLLTNGLADMSLTEGLSPRQILEPGPSFNDLSETMAENHLGMNCLMQTTDGFFVIAHSGHGILETASSVSGEARMSVCRDDKGGYSATAWLDNRVKKALPCLLDDKGRIDHRVVELSKAHVLGATRNMVSCGRPELFFVCDLAIDHNDLLGLMHERHRGGGDSFMLIHEDEIFSTLDTEAVVEHGGPSQCPILTYQGNTYRVSESLLSNLLLHRMDR